MKPIKFVKIKPIQNKFLRTIFLTISTGFGLGLIPKAPGTFGSLLGIPLGLVFLQISPIAAVIWTALLLVALSWIADKTSRHWGEMDSGKIVSDEVLGQAIALMGLRYVGPKIESALGWIVPEWPLILLSFVLFRIFDIYKPFPAKSFDQRKDGFGVVMDDVVAGTYAALVTYAITKMYYI